MSIARGPGTWGPHRGTSPQTGSLPETDDPRIFTRKTAAANLPHARNVRKLRHFQYFRANLRNRWGATVFLLFDMGLMV